MSTEASINLTVAFLDTNRILISLSDGLAKNLLPACLIFSILALTALRMPEVLSVLIETSER